MKSSEISYHLAFRFAASPIMFPFFLFYLLPYNYLPLNIFLALLFLAMRFSGLSITQLAKTYHFDRYLYKDIAAVADIFFLYSVLLVLVAVGRIYFYWMIFLLGIDFFMLASRRLATHEGGKIEVSSYLEKSRMIFFVIWLVVSIIDPTQHVQGSTAFTFFGLELVLLWTTIGLSLALAQKYFDTMYTQRGTDMQHLTDASLHAPSDHEDLYE